MGESLSFQQALEQTVKDFGGRNNIQRMEWTYRKAFLLNQLRDWWALVKSQFSKSKLLRSMITVGLVIMVSLYFSLTDLNGATERQITIFTLESSSIIPILSLTWFLLQSFVPSFKKAGLIRFPRLFRGMLSYLLVASTLLLSLVIGTLEISMLLKGLGYSALWSTSALLYLGYLDYSMKTAPELWHQTKIADH